MASHVVFHPTFSQIFGNGFFLRAGSGHIFLEFRVLPCTFILNFEFFDYSTLGFDNYRLILAQTLEKQNRQLYINCTCVMMGEEGEQVLGMLGHQIGGLGPLHAHRVEIYSRSCSLLEIERMGL